MDHSHNTLKQWNLGVSAGVKPLTFVAYQGDGYNLTYIEAQTAQRRANSYQKLVDALRNIMDNEWDANGATATGKSVRALLIEVGEAS